MDLVKPNHQENSPFIAIETISRPSPSLVYPSSRGSIVCRIIIGLRDGANASAQNNNAPEQLLEDAPPPVSAVAPRALTSYFSPARRNQVSTFRQKGEIDGSIGVRVNWYRYTTSFSKFALWTVGFTSFSFLAATAGAAAASELVAAPSPPSARAAPPSAGFSSDFLSAAASPAAAAPSPPAPGAAGLSPVAAGAASVVAAVAAAAVCSTFFSSSPATTGLFSVSVAIFTMIAGVWVFENHDTGVEIREQAALAGREVRTKYGHGQTCAFFTLGLEEFLQETERKTGISSWEGTAADAQHSEKGR
uniref:Uncharacterized protein n=1 Tax=Anopheles farauti TaxID=69004 RepID=A0A182Q0J8_9DIPT